MPDDEHNIDMTDDSETVVSDILPKMVAETKNLSKIDVARLLLDRAINRAAYYADLVSALQNYIEYLHKDN